MTDHNSSLVNLSIPKEVTTPIVSAKIQEAVLAALGGADAIISGVVKTICETKVREHDGRKPEYSSDKTVSWMDYHVSSIIKKEVEEKIKEQLKVGADTIAEEIAKQLRTKQGSSKIAKALLDGFAGTMANGWTSKINIEFSERK